jgi:hypothetical protein
MIVSDACAALALALALVINYAPRVVSYSPKVMLQIVTSFTLVNYNSNVFIVQTTVVNFTKIFFFVTNDAGKKLKRSLELQLFQSCLIFSG